MRQLILEFGGLAAPPMLLVPHTLFWGLGFGMSHSIVALGFVHGNGEKWAVGVIRSLKQCLQRLIPL